MFDHLSASYTGGAGLAAGLAVTTAVAGGEVGALLAVRSHNHSLPRQPTTMIG